VSTLSRAAQEPALRQRSRAPAREPCPVAATVTKRARN
jgi:hypothetical protein